MTDDSGLRIGLFGRGRLASAIVTCIAERSVGSVVWQMGRDENPEAPGDDANAVDVAIDASVAAGVGAHVDWAIEDRTPLVIGVTGWTLDDLEQRVGDRIGVVVAPNLSIGAALTRRIAHVLGGFAALDETRDPYVFEHHHAAKIDAPSGTAIQLAEAVLAACPRKREWHLVEGNVRPDQLAVASLRAGSEFGLHTVGVDGTEEKIEITHQAHSRAAFGVGALVAARWIHDRTGVHPFDSVVADLLNPLFSFPPL